MVEYRVVALKKLWFSRISDGMGLHVPLNKIDFNSSYARFCLSPAFVIYSVPITCYVSGIAQDHADGPCGILCVINSVLRVKGYMEFESLRVLMQTLLPVRIFHCMISPP